MAFGETYPMRSGAPQSQVVAYAPNPTEWGTDWSQRYTDQAAKGPGVNFGDLLRQQVNDYAASSAQPGRFAPGSNTTDDPALQSAFDFARNAFAHPDANFLTGNAPGTTLPANTPSNRDAATSMFGEDFYPTLSAWNYKQSPRYLGQQMQSLTDEKNRMLPMLEGQTRAQSAYDHMLGDGQINGVMSADYSNPDFGQITGDFGQSKLGTAGFGAKPAGTGIPGMSSAPATVWGAAPQRVRQWGI